MCIINIAKVLFVVKTLVQFLRKKDCQADKQPWKYKIAATLISNYKL